MHDSYSPLTASQKLWRVILIGMALAIPLFVVWLLVYDRQDQSTEAQRSIAEGWGGAQAIEGPMLAIPYLGRVESSVGEGQNKVVTSKPVWRELTLQPEVARIASQVDPEVRKRSIYEAVVYTATAKGLVRFAMPADLERYGVPIDRLDLAHAELRFGLSDPRGLGANPVVKVDGRPVRLFPGNGGGRTKGFSAYVDATPLTTRAMSVDFDYAFRGNGSLSLIPQAGDTRWQVSGSWPNPSFGGDFLPMRREVTKSGFTADYPIGNLALGKALVSVADKGESEVAGTYRAGDESQSRGRDTLEAASINLIQPVDIYSRVDRATKYGFLFIGFTFLALLMFDIIGGVRVGNVEYLLTGAALVLFFVMLLAFAEVIGFTPAYIAAALAIAGLETSYSAAVLGSWRRGYVVGGLLIALYAVLYVLLGLEALSLLIGSLLLFAALAGVMYVTRNIDWGRESVVA